MKFIKDWWIVLVSVATFAVQWGIVTTKVYAFDKDHANVVEVKERLAGIEEVLNSNSNDHRRIESELLQVRTLLLKIYEGKR